MSSFQSSSSKLSWARAAPTRRIRASAARALRASDRAARRGLRRRARRASGSRQASSSRSSSAGSHRFSSRGGLAASSVTARAIVDAHDEPGLRGALAAPGDLPRTIPRRLPGARISRRGPPPMGVSGSGPSSGASRKRTPSISTRPAASRAASRRPAESRARRAGLGRQVLAKAGECALFGRGVDGAAGARRALFGAQRVEPLRALEQLLELGARRGVAGELAPVEGLQRGSLLQEQPLQDLVTPGFGDAHGDTSRFPGRRRRRMPRRRCSPR